MQTLKAEKILCSTEFVNLFLLKLPLKLMATKNVKNIHSQYKTITGRRQTNMTYQMQVP